MITATATVNAERSTTRTALAWGIGVGVAQGAIALGFWWLELSTVHALMIALIAAVYVGLAVRDGRAHVIAVESMVVVAFFTAAATAVAVTPWLLVAIYLAHGAKDLWQHRHGFVRGTRWWPPFCFAVDMAVAGFVAAQILLGVEFHG
jgi:hypothetical protein